MSFDARHHKIAEAAHGLNCHQLQRLFCLFEEIFFATPVSILLFGSRCRGQHRSGADVDLAFDSTVPLERELTLLREALELSTLPFLFDLVDLKQVDATLAENIAKESIVLWTR